MGVPRRLLRPDEHVLVDIRPHWLAVVGPLVAALVVVGVAVTLEIAFPRSGSTIHWIEGIAAGLPLLWLVLRMLRWRTTELVVTTERVLVRHHLGAERVAQVPLVEVSRVEVERHLLGRLAGSGTVVVVAADLDGDHIALVVDDVRHPDVLQRIVHRRARRYDGGARPYPPGYRPGWPAR